MTYPGGESRAGNAGSIVSNRGLELGLMSTYQGHATCVRPSSCTRSQALSEFGLVLSSVRRLASCADSQFIIDYSLTAVRLQREERAGQLVGRRVRVAMERLTLRENQRKAEQEEEGDGDGGEAQRAVHLGRDQRVNTDDEGVGCDGGEDTRGMMVGLVEQIASRTRQMLDKQLQKCGRGGEDRRRRR